MSIFTVLFKLFPYLLPFFKEMLIGKKTWKQALRENRIKTVTLIVVTVSLILNLVLLVKIGSLAFNYLELARANQELEHKAALQTKAKGAIDSSPKVPVINNMPVTANVKKEGSAPVEVKPSSLPTKRQVARTDAIKAEFARLQQREAAEQ